MRLSRPVSLKMAFRVSIHASVKDATRFRLSYVLMLIVSIHASVKDATVRETDAKVNLSVSIHASVKDATITLTYNPEHLPSFNPRICKRCDKALDFDRIYIRVSIHASVKDATKS